MMVAPTKTCRTEGPCPISVCDCGFYDKPAALSHPPQAPVGALKALEHTEGEAKRWLVEEALEGGSIRWETYEHEHHARSVASRLLDPNTVKVSPLYASPVKGEGPSVKALRAAYDQGWNDSKSEPRPFAAARKSMGDRYIAALSVQAEPVEAEIASVVQRVNEWDDRTSPDDYPDHLLITSEELADILRNFASVLIGGEA